jgi:hypothetical protein
VLDYEKQEIPGWEGGLDGWQPDLCGEFAVEL